VVSSLANDKDRYWGKYRGVVTAVDEATCRVKAEMVGMYGDTSETGWCAPCVPYAGPKVGMAFLPEVGSGVWVEFEGGDVSRPVWVGAYWLQTSDVPQDIRSDVKVLTTVAGLTLTFDDGKSTLTMTDTNGNSASLSSDGITLSNTAQKLVVSASSIAIDDDALVVS
jgi:uncharacterized protein involved in type VI secretion and phage assembly